MFDQRLMERALAGGRVAPGSTNASDVLADVIRHLGELLNVRQGAVPTRPDYGMPDINGLLNRFPDAIGVLGHAIGEQIRRFEPRLANPVVRHIPALEDPLTLRYAISADLLLDDRRERVSFASAIGDDGSIRLST